MLCYLGVGARYYAEAPVRVSRRLHWEFQAVLSGRIALVEERGATQLQTRRLWLSAPGHAHGWTGQPGQVAEVAVFQFLRIPEPLARKASPSGHLEISLTHSQTQRLRHLSELAESSRKRPGPAMLLRHEHILLELSLIILENDEQISARLEDAPHTRVQRALDWFSNHLETNPGLDQVASAAGGSVPQLRRDFYAIMQASPKKIFDQLRFQRAMQMMADPETKLSAVSEACGFESPSTFSRAFRLKFGVSPDHWRGGTLRF